MGHPETVKRKIRLIAIVLLLFSCPTILAEDLTAEWGGILSSAESMFKAMKGRSYPAIWRYLTAGSKKAIVDNVYKASYKAGIEYSKDQINTDFGIGGLIAKTYWGGYLAEFDPDMVLEQSRWGLGFIKNERAEIVIQYKNAEKPALLKMFKEGNSWKVGLEESFVGRRYLFIQ